MAQASILACLCGGLAGVVTEDSCASQLCDQAVFLAYCQQVFELRLFARLRGGLAQRGQTLVIVTHLLSVWMLARRAGISCRLITGAHSGASSELTDVGAAQEIRQGDCTVAAAQQFHAALWQALDAETARRSVGMVAVYNGTRLAGRSAVAFARARGIATLFLELGNVDRKLFADPMGANASSSVANSPAVLDAMPVPEGEFAAWKKDYAQRRLQIIAPPQARKMRWPNIYYPIDQFGAMVLRLPQPCRVSTWTKLHRKLSQLISRSTPNIKPEGPYVFLPLQVSSDANLVLYSDYDNAAAIAVAAGRARELGCTLVVRPHPAESRMDIMRQMERLCAEGGHLLTGWNGLDLILGAQEVITINSTIGLEAKLFDKPVTVLGRSLYASFTQAQLASYLLRYLVDFDPFGHEDASLAVIDRLLSIGARAPLADIRSEEV